MRCNASGSAPTSRASSSTGRGPSARASATPRSAVIASNLVTSAPQKSRQRSPSVRLRRHRRHSDGRDSCGDLVGLVVGERPAVEQRAPVADDGDHRRLVHAEGGGQLLLDGTGEARQLGQRQRAAADARDGLLDGAAGRARPAAPRGRERPRPARAASAAPGSRPAGRGRARASLRALRASACPSAGRGGADAGAAARPGRSGRRRSPPAGRRAACRRRSRRGRRPRRAPPPGSARPRRRRARPSRGRREAGSSWRRATAASSSSRGCSVKPTTRKFDWWTRSRSAVSGPIARS